MPMPPMETCVRGMNEESPCSPMQNASTWSRSTSTMLAMWRLRRTVSSDVPVLNTLARGRSSLR